MAYEGRCGSCANFEENSGRALFDSNNPSYIKGYCTWYNCFYYPDDYCDKHYHARTSSGNGCFITAMVCDVLGYADDCEVMETLRNFRGNVLQKDEKYRDVLFEYDTVGPQIAQNLRFEDLEFVNGIYQKFLIPIVKMIKRRRNDEAVERYKSMTNMLGDFYGVSSNQSVFEEYDYTKGGHGNKVLKLKNIQI